MNWGVVVSAVGITVLGGAAVVFAQGAPQAPQQPMSFFVTSTVPGTGNLGGLAGADKICQDLAAAAGAGGKTWHAYLSQSQPPVGNRPPVNARDRIGTGPWYNAKGVLIARNVADLHGDVQRDRNNIQKTTALDEKGQLVNGEGNQPVKHAILTGSDSEGRAFPTLTDATCNNWTSDTDQYHAMMGHHDRSGGVNVSWNAVHMSMGCTAAAFGRTGGAGLFYCFAIN